MKHIHLLLTVVLTLIFFTTYSALADNLPWEPVLPFKQATITYRINGSEKGAETLYIKDKGNMQATHHDASMSVFGMSTRTRTIEIKTPEWVTTYDLEENTAQKVRNPLKIYQERYNSLTTAEKKNVEKNSRELGSSFLVNMGGHTTQNSSEILGYSCDITEIKGIATVHTIHDAGIPLLTKTSVMGMSTTIEATSIDTKTTIPNTMFTGPKNITVEHDTQAEQMMTQMIDSVIDKLKQPDGAQLMKENPTPGITGGGTALPQQTPPSGGQPEAGDMMQEMEQGMKMLKGLFGD